MYTIYRYRPSAHYPFIQINTTTRECSLWTSSLSEASLFALIKRLPPFFNPADNNFTKLVESSVLITPTTHPELLV